MKKLLCYIALVALSALMVCSCKDSDLEPTPAPEKSEGADYLVMFYACGGGNLDSGIIGNIMQALDEGSNEKVKVTFEYKMSDSLQHKAALKDFEGTRRFTADENAHLKGQFLSLTDNYPTLDDKELPGVVSQIKSERIGDAKYDMSSSEGLADFIKWSKEQYPSAKHKILVISNHGGAWSLNNDGKIDTRSVLHDDNLDGKALSLHRVVDGVNDGGGVDLLYMDACLMSTYENLYGYVNCVKYLMAAFETQAGLGGDYRVLTKLLKIAGSGEENMVRTMKKYVDYCNSDGWWEKNWDYCTDLGLYDLSKLGLVTPVLKKITDTLAELYASDAKIDLENEDIPLLSDTYAPYIRNAMSECIVGFSNPLIHADSIPSIMASYLRADGIKDEDQYFKSIEVIKWIRFGQTEYAQEAIELYPEEWHKLTKYIYKLGYTSFSLPSLLYILDASLKQAGAVQNPFRPLHDELIAALRQLAYIKCTKVKADPKKFDTAYEMCSPGIYLVPFNDLYYLEENAATVKKIPTYAEALRYYQNTEFDQLVGWSRVLCLLDVFPTAFTNAMRDYADQIEPNPESYWNTPGVSSITSRVFTSCLKIGM